MSDLRARVSDGIEVVLVGNKADMSAKREVEEAEGKALAASVGAAAFFETSCRSGANVADAYQALGEHAFRRKMAGAEGPRARKVRVNTETDAGEVNGGA